MKHRIVIVGGGTAGWMAANLMAHHWQDANIEITVVESPDIGIIGVGEGSTPTLKRFFADLGIAEHEWMPQCNATYKVNIDFQGWSPASGLTSYSHPFISQLDTYSERPFRVNCLTRRLGLDVNTDPAKFLFNGWLSKHNKAPITPANVPFRIEYGYHFDSGLLGQFLTQRAQQKGVGVNKKNVEEVVLNEQGNIASLRCADGSVIEGDFFIDCTGFRSLLLQQTLKVPFKLFKDNLFNDSAVVMPTAKQEVLPVATTAKALSNGWMWQIPLTHRTGNGYVYSSDFTDDNEAETELRQQLNLLDSEQGARFLKMKVGQVEKHWYQNCLALGLAQGFIEPLEATALHLVQLTIERFIEAYSEGQFTNQHQNAFNQETSERFESVRDYIVAHYKLNTRDDSDYWRENRANMNLSDSLLHILDAWYRQKDVSDVISKLQQKSHFGVTSWHCLLAGYGAFPKLAAHQPGKGDLYTDNELDSLFTGCLLNFPSHSEALDGLKRSA